MADRLVYCVLAMLLAAPSVASAQDPGPALKAIGDAADNVCGILRTAGSTRNAKATGAVRAALSGLTRHLADLGVSLGTEVEQTAYDNVLRSDLASDLKDARTCRTHIFDVLQTKLLPTPPAKVETVPASLPQDAGSALDNAPGRWTTGSVKQCNSDYYVWSIWGDQSTFRDQSEQVDIERIGKVTDKQLTTTTLASVHSLKGKPEPTGSTWQYTFIDTDRVSVRNLTDGRSFELKRCKQT